MLKTTHYQLNQWEPTDKLSRTDFNADNAAIDAAIKAVETAVGNKAEQSAVTALTAALGSGGQTARIAYGTYTGTGTYGADNPNSLSFDFCPVMVVCYAGSYALWPTIFMRGATSASGGDAKDPISFTLSWASNAVTWYEANSAAKQLNTGGTTYYYMVLGYTA